jgi:hypothetical protein
MYISVHPAFTKNIISLKYSKTETVDSIEKIQHIYFKDILKKFNLSGIEITSTADVPAGTGLGSSSSFTVGVLHTLNAYCGRYVSKEELAKAACKVEIEDLKQPIGKQDQYAASFGNLNFYSFERDGTVIVEPVILSREKSEELQDNLVMFYVGDVRSASSILQEQDKNIKNGYCEVNQLNLCKLARELRNELNNGRIDSLGEILHDGWQLKRTLATGISNPLIDQYYETAIKNGAIGGKLLGAGGGGFLLFYVKKDKRQDLISNMSLMEVPFRFDKQGSAIVYVGQK